MTESPEIRLDHINLPAARPEWLADWYAELFGFRSKEGFVIGPGTLIVFEPGTPLDYGDNPHFGFRCTSREKVVYWAERLEATVVEEDSYFGFKASDPEGNHFEVYWEAER